MQRSEVESLGDLIFWADANLAMAEANLKRGKSSPGKIGYMVRAKLWKGLKTGAPK
jgi:hypothetical protein